MGRGIRQDEWLAEIERIQREHRKQMEDGVTRRELQEITGLGPHVLRNFMNRVKADGRLTVSTAYREALDGTLRPVPIYHIGQHRKARTKK